MSLLSHSHIPVYHLHIFLMSLVCLVCRSYATRMYPYIFRMTLICTRMTSVSHWYVLECHPYVTLMFLHSTRMSLVCNCMSSACHSSVVWIWTICLVSRRISNTFEQIIMKLTQCNLLIYIKKTVQLSRLIEPKTLYNLEI